MTNPATLVLADGTTFSGLSIGKEGSTVGNVVFNTAMIGYQELLTDPASKDQLIAFTYPHIGNTGINQEDRGSDHVQAAGLIIRDLPLLTSNFRSEEKLEDYLVRHGLVAIAGIDTRRLTRHLRTFGSQAGCIVTGENPDITAATEKAKAWEPSQVDISSCDQKAYEWSEGKWQLGRGFHQGIGEKPLHVVVMDLGVTKDVLRHFAESGCRVTVVPSSTKAGDIFALHPNGVFLSNGSGNLSAYQTVVTDIASLIESEIPLFAVGLGHQLLGISLGGKTQKLSHGHHGVNHPVQEIHSGKVMMTTQNNHDVLVEESLPETVIVTHHSLIDHSVQGIRLSNQCVYSFQGYPEGDATYLFDQLIDAMWTK